MQRAQILFSQNQEEILKSRRLNGPYKFSSTNVHGDFQYMLDEANSFNLNPSADRFDYMISTTPIPSGTEGLQYDPVPINIANRENAASDNIHYAAIEAYLTGNAELGQKVAEQILLRAKDDKLDFGNGRGANNPNATYGTINRWNSQSTENNPRFLTILKVLKYMESISLLKDKGLFSLNDEDENRIDGWFRDAKNYSRDKLNFHRSTSLGAGWPTYNFASTGWNSIASYNIQPYIVSSTGVPLDGYLATKVQHVIYSNIPNVYPYYVFIYGLLYNDLESIEYGKRYFEEFYKFGLFPDGSHFELDRARENGPLLGMSYWALSLGYRVRMAQAYALAYINNLPSKQHISNPFELFEFTTSEGWHQYLPNYTGGSTTGGNKGLKLELDSYAKYAGNQWIPSRHANVTGYPLHRPVGNLSHIGPVALANSYYQDENLRQLYKGEGIYPKTLTYSEGAGWIGAWRESSFGGFGSYLLGYGLYFDMEGKIFTLPKLETNSATATILLNN